MHGSAKSLNRDWKTSLDGKQIQRWSEALGRSMVRGRDRKSQAHREGRYPEYRAKGWPIESGVTEAGVKQFNKRVKGTEQFWEEARIELILTLRAAWVSQDERWDRYWDNRPAYVN